MTDADAHLPSDAGGDHWLAIAEEEFVPATSGGRVESVNLLRAAVEAGIRLYVVVPGLTSGPMITAHREALPGQRLEGIPRATTWRSHLSWQPYVFKSRPLPLGFLDQARQLHADDPFDVVLAVSFRVAHVGLSLANAIGVPLLIRPHNRESSYFEQLAQTSPFPRNVAYRVEAYKMRRAESSIHAAGVGLFADISHSDAHWRASRTHTPVLHVPPFVEMTSNVEPADPQDPKDEHSCTLLFLGALDFPNNVAGIRWFIQRCWPELRTRDGALDLHVVGRRAPRALVDELVEAGARVTSDAPQIRPLLLKADVFVNPVQRGSGVNIKMVEAMHAGLPVVSTTVGARGLSWRDGEHLMLADSPEKFTRAVVQLLADRDLSHRIGSGGQQFVLEELGGVRHIHRMASLLGRPHSTD